MRASSAKSTSICCIQEVTPGEELPFFFIFIPIEDEQGDKQERSFIGSLKCVTK